MCYYTVLYSIEGNPVYAQHGKVKAIPERLMVDMKSSGWRRGSCIVSSISFLTSARPPMSFHLTLGIWNTANSDGVQLL